MKYLIFIGLLLNTLITVAQKATPTAYIQQYAKMAQQEMQRSGVPAAITLAQGILESESGNSDLAIKGNNHFGIKCKQNWVGGSIYHDDDAKQECFRKYETVAQSYIDHSDFLKNNDRYSTLFLLDPADYKGWAKGLKKAGYATNPVYAQKLIDLIEKYELHLYNDLAYNKFENNSTVPITENAQPSETISGDMNVTNEKKDVVKVKSYNELLYINQTKATYLEEGTSLLATAEKYSIALDKLLDFNDLPKSTADILAKDALIFLQRKRKQGAISTHIVMANETLYDIAQTEGIRMEMLLNYNNLQKNEQPLPGEVLSLTSKTNTKPKLLISK